MNHKFLCIQFQSNAFEKEKVNDKIVLVSTIPGTQKRRFSESWIVLKPNLALLPPDLLF
jgi:hypothetical protein